MTQASIFVRGPALRVAMVGAYLARRWLGAGRRLILSPIKSGSEVGTFVARPDHLRFHAEVGVSLDTLIRQADARPLVAPTYASAKGEIMLPFLPIGKSHGGIEFQHFWCRANRVEEQPDLLSFSQAIAIQHSEHALSWNNIKKGAAGFGLTLRQDLYVQILMGLASELGAEIVDPDSHGAQGDLVIACAGVPDPSWAGSVITMPLASALPGMEWQLSANAVRRIVGLSSSSSNSESERREYTRLAAAEGERIADMEELLTAEELSPCTSPTLQRKVDLFQACGRIPTEDFEVFMQPEWLAALWLKGLLPRRYDRMADRLPKGQLMAMMAQLRTQTEALTQMKENA